MNDVSETSKFHFAENSPGVPYYYYDFPYYYYEWEGPCPEGYEGTVTLWIVYDEFDIVIASGGEGVCEPIQGPQTPQP